jgi:hypothetical protein
MTVVRSFSRVARQAREIHGHLFMDICLEKWTFVWRTNQTANITINTMVAKPCSHWNLKPANELKQHNI